MHRTGRRTILHQAGQGERLWKILLVEHDQLVAFQVRCQLGALAFPFILLRAVNRRHYWYHLERDMPDVVIVDYEFGGLTIGAARQRSAQMPIVVLLNEERGDRAEDALGQGADRVLLLNSQLSELPGVVERLLRERGRVPGGDGNAEAGEPDRLAFHKKVP